MQTYYGFIEEIMELDYGQNLQILVFKCKWAQLKAVEVENYGFTTVDLSVAGFKDNSWILANNVAHVFYITNPTNKKKKIVLPGKQQIARVENVTDAEEYNQFNEILPLEDLEKLKRVEAIVSKTLIPHLRTDIKGKVIQVGK